LSDVIFDLNAALAELPVLGFQDGDVIVAEGKKANGIDFLKSGQVAVDRDGERVADIGEFGFAFGDVAILLDMLALTETRAVGAVSVYAVRDVEAFSLERPELLLHLTRGMARKMHFMASYLTDIKKQYADEGSHLGMVNEVLNSFLHTKH
jgi:CRP/FNR family cyclic AMP-dependent transcriptional regulator